MNWKCIFTQDALFKYLFTVVTKTEPKLNLFKFYLIDMNNIYE